MQAQREAPPDMQCKDKFLVQSVIAPFGSSAKDVSQELVRSPSSYRILYRVVEGLDLYVFAG